VHEELDKNKASYGHVQASQQRTTTQLERLRTLGARLDDSVALLHVHETEVCPTGGCSTRWFSAHTHTHSLLCTDGGRWQLARLLQDARLMQRIEAVWYAITILGRGTCVAGGCAWLLALLRGVGMGALGQDCLVCCW
jgi:hypothetical protein